MNFNFPGQIWSGPLKPLLPGSPEWPDTEWPWAILYLMGTRDAVFPCHRNDLVVFFIHKVQQQSVSLLQ